jgi:hypothetical protein
MNFKIFLIATAFTLATIASANADTTCAVNSPDGELNVRELTQNGPGKVTDKLQNGYIVTIRDFYLLKGQSWARVVDGKTKTKVVGWVFKDYLNCNIQATASPVQQPQPKPQPKPSSAAISSERLLEDCTASEKFEPWKRTYCYAYIRGLGDGVGLAGACIQDQSAADLVDAMLPFLRKMSPKDLEKDATLTVPAIWDKLWPCKEERQS